MSSFRNESTAVWWHTPGLVQHSAAYVVDRHSDELFEHHRIPRPSALHDAVPKRRAEFLSGRYCAARVLERMDMKTEVGISRHRAPIWPDSVVGSISHTSDKAVAVAVAMRALDVLGLGIDIERVRGVGACPYGGACSRGQGTEAPGMVLLTRRAPA